MGVDRNQGINRCESSPPISTRSGFSKSRIAEPSARNSGLESTESFVLQGLQPVRGQISLMT